MDKKIETFLADMKKNAKEQFLIVEKIRKIYDASHTKLTEKFIYGGIGVYLGDKLISGIWIYTKHVSVVFSDGYKLQDTEKMLEGGGKYRRHLKIFCESDIKEKKVKEFIEKCIALETTQ